MLKSLQKKFLKNTITASEAEKFADINIQLLKETHPENARRLLYHNITPKISSRIVSLMTSKYREFFIELFSDIHAEEPTPLHTVLLGVLYRALSDEFLKKYFSTSRFKETFIYYMAPYLHIISLFDKSQLYRIISLLENQPPSVCALFLANKHITNYPTIMARILLKSKNLKYLCYFSADNPLFIPQQVFEMMSTKQIRSLLQNIHIERLGYIFITKDTKQLLVRKATPLIIANPEILNKINQMKVVSSHKV